MQIPELEQSEPQGSPDYEELYNITSAYLRKAEGELSCAVAALELIIEEAERVKACSDVFIGDPTFVERLEQAKVMAEIAKEGLPTKRKQIEE